MRDFVDNPVTIVEKIVNTSAAKENAQCCAEMYVFHAWVHVKINVNILNVNNLVRNIV